MEPKGDEHLHHPVREVCQKEFDDVHVLSKHLMKNIEIKTERHKDKSNYDEDSALYLLSSLLLEYGSSLSVTVHNLY
jgi:hypothetical protein